MYRYTESKLMPTQTFVGMMRMYNIDSHALPFDVWLWLVHWFVVCINTVVFASKCIHCAYWALVACFCLEGYLFIIGYMLVSVCLDFSALVYILTTLLQRSIYIYIYIYIYLYIICTYTYLYTCMRGRLHMQVVYFTSFMFSPVVFCCITFCLYHF